MSPAGRTCRWCTSIPPPLQRRFPFKFAMEQSRFCISFRVGVPVPRFETRYTRLHASGLRFPGNLRRVAIERASRSNSITPSVSLIWYTCSASFPRSVRRRRRSPFLIARQFKMRAIRGARRWYTSIPHVGRTTNACALSFTPAISAFYRQPH